MRFAFLVLLVIGSNDRAVATGYDFGMCAQELHRAAVHIRAKIDQDPQYDYYDEDDKDELARRNARLFYLERIEKRFRFDFGAIQILSDQYEVSLSQLVSAAIDNNGLSGRQELETARDDISILLSPTLFYRLGNQNDQLMESLVQYITLEGSIIGDYRRLFIIRSTVPHALMLVDYREAFSKTLAAKVSYERKLSEATPEERELANQSGLYAAFQEPVAFWQNDPGIPTDSLLSRTQALIDDKGVPLGFKRLLRVHLRFLRDYNLPPDSLATLVQILEGFN